MMDVLLDSAFSHHSPPCIDLQRRLEIFRNDLDRIFVSNGSLRMWEDDGVSPTPSETTFTSVEDLTARHLNRELRRLGNCFFFISQSNSWSSLNVSAEMLLNVIAHHRLGPILMEYLHCFGTKVTGDDNPYYGNFHAEFVLANATASGGCAQSYDFCSHLRRYEIHGNSQMKDPWSLRQMTVYQRYDLTSKKSIWLLIKPFEHCQSILQQFVPEKNSHHPMKLQLLFFTMATENWRWYIDFLRKSLLDFTEKAIFSRFDAANISYDIKFNDSQRLSKLESKLTVAISVLEQSVAIGQGMMSHCQRLKHLTNQHFDQSTERTIENDFEVHVASLKLHKVSCELLLQQLRGTHEMLLKVLDHRNDLVMEEQSRIATQLAKSSNLQNHALSVLAHEAKRDSRVMRVLTIVAIAYVPASLIASIFSSDLIKVSDANISTNSFHVSKDIWVFVLSSFFVTMVTMVPAIWLTPRT